MYNEIEKSSISIDSVDDSHGRQIVVAQLVLEGDFVDAVEKYMADTDNITLILDLPRSIAQELFIELEKLLYG